MSQQRPIEKWDIDHGRVFASPEQARTIISEYTERFYNLERNSTNNYASPIDLEAESSRIYKGCIKNLSAKAGPPKNGPRDFSGPHQGCSGPMLVSDFLLPTSCLPRELTDRPARLSTSGIARRGPKLRERTWTS